MENLSTELQLQKAKLADANAREFARAYEARVETMANECVRACEIGVSAWQAMHWNGLQSSYHYQEATGFEREVFKRDVYRRIEEKLGHEPPRGMNRKKNAVERAILMP